RTLTAGVRLDPAEEDRRLAPGIEREQPELAISRCRRRIPLRPCRPIPGPCVTEIDDRAVVAWDRGAAGDAAVQNGLFAHRVVGDLHVKPVIGSPHRSDPWDPQPPGTGWLPGGMQLCPPPAIPAPGVVAEGVGLIEAVTAEEHDALSGRIPYHPPCLTPLGAGRR